MAKDERGAAASKLIQMINAKKTGSPVAAASSSRPGTSSPTKKPVTPKVTLSKMTPGVRGTALVVDSNARLAITLQNTLKVLRFRADTAATGAEALQALGKTPYDLVMVDLQLPDIGGFNLCSKLRVLAEGRPMMVVITGEDRSAGMKDQALMVDADDYMAKPINTGELGALLDTLRKGRGIADEEPEDLSSGNRLPPGQI